MEDFAMTVSGDPGGRPLILLHGGGRDRSDWDAVTPAFAGTHRVFAFDQRGFGESARSGQYSFTLMRDDVLTLMDRHGIEQADIIGHSMGGTVAWLVAQAQPARVRRLVIVDTPPPRQGQRRFDVGPRPEQDPGFDWAALEAIVAELNDPDPQWWDNLKTVTAPTLLIAGGEKSHVPQHLLSETLAMVADGRMVEIPVGHSPHRDAPDDFCAAIAPFLK